MLFDTPSRIFVLVLWILIGLGYLIVGLIQKDEIRAYGGAGILTAFIIIIIKNCM